MRVSQSTISIILLILFLFSFLGIITKVWIDHDKDGALVTKNAPGVRIGSGKATEAIQAIVKKLEGKILPPDSRVAIDPDATPIIATHKSKFAYVTLMHGMENVKFGYRGYLYNVLLAKQSLEKLGSTADFVVLVGFNNGSDPDDKTINADLQMLRDKGLIVYYLPRLLTEEEQLISSQFSKKKVGMVTFAEMALLKITPFNFLEYERIQFLDGDVLPFKNMDCLFSLDRNTFNTGSASPVNSGWYLAVPNHEDYLSMKALAVQRLTHKWDEKSGWGKELPSEAGGQTPLYYRSSQKPVKKWDFNGASLDQGLVTHHFVLGQGRIQLLDTKAVRVYEPGYTMKEDTVGEVLHVCEGSALPTSMFYHFTGDQKPWLKDLRNPPGPGYKLWAQLLDGLKMEITSQNIHKYPLNSPLGSFHPNQ